MRSIWSQVDKFRRVILVRRHWWFTEWQWQAGCQLCDRYLPIAYAPPTPAGLVAVHGAAMAHASSAAHMRAVRNITRGAQA